ncbi:uncharacterized protein DNG_01049 [Cephalotrichum gorgonifer]|uniref:Uncharacterized protein n=1 Tax=Cephalotrichum gorgonifer TaxID=2041049 RepID=A0AAE8MQM1_9PEZI|nr:uncharacterized protein DNG_01049 [Cephalotrichum gorgonifer]
MDPVHDAPPPPYSETDIYSQPGNNAPSVASSNARRGDDNVSSSTENIIYTPPLTPTTAPGVTWEPAPAAAAFFDSRPATTATPPERLEHTIVISEEVRPQDLASQPGFAARDVTEQDWKTFINFLLPDHVARSNHAVADRKLRAESSAGSTGGDAEAQLGSLRSDDGAQPQPMPRREEMERTVEEWNTFFFAPRGIKIRLSPDTETRRMPGAWDQSFDNHAGNANEDPASSNAGPSARGPQAQTVWGMGGIRVTQDGISFGNALAADRFGIRLGQFTADQSGISYGGRTLFANPQHNPMARGLEGHHGPAWPPQPAPPAPRGRHAHEADGNHQRSSSKSSSSDSSSDSDSSDGEGVGDLLDFDELFGHDQLAGAQFDVCSATLHRWLNSPQQHITKADVRELKREVRAARSHNNALSSAERKEYKAGLKSLLKEMKGLVKQQKQERKQVKRQEKQRRRAEKRERKQQNREMRRARKEQGRRGGFPPVPSMPPMPSMPSMPPVPPQPPAPPMPHAGLCNPLGRGGHPGHGMFSPWGGGCGNRDGPFGGRGRGRGRGRGAYQGPLGFFPSPEVPGGWPTGHSHHRSHYESYTSAIKKLEDRISERTATLSRLENDMASRASGGGGWSARRAEGRKHGLEKEIEALQNSMEGLQVRADEEYAKMVAAEEDGARG